MRNLICLSILLLGGFLNQSHAAYVKTFYVFVNYYDVNDQSEVLNQVFSLNIGPAYFNGEALRMQAVFPRPFSDDITYLTFDFQLEPTDKRGLLKLSVSGFDEVGRGFFESTGYSTGRHKKFSFVKDFFDQDGKRLATVAVSSAKRWKNSIYRKMSNLAQVRGIPSYMHAQSISDKCQGEFVEVSAEYTLNGGFFCFKKLY